MRRLFEALLAQVSGQGDCMLVTIVGHAGSVPRGTGTQMLLNRAGRVAGTVGGGEAERTAIRLGTAMLAAGESGLHELAQRPRAGEGAACAGGITLRFQYVACGDARWRDVADRALKEMEAGRRVWLIQRFSGGAPALLAEDGAPVSGEAPDDAAALCAAQPVRTQSCFALPLLAGERVVIFGAGHCAQALAPLLCGVGFRVTVYDDRAALADAAHFPQAERVLCAGLDRIADMLPLLADDFIVAMTSTHDGDACVLAQAMREEHAHVSMLGGTAKGAYVRGILRERGIPQARIDRLHTPIGLTIGAVTPQEIAVSIAAEMIAARAARRANA